jgi:hypothetical protein
MGLFQDLFGRQDIRMQDHNQQSSNTEIDLLNVQCNSYRKKEKINDHQAKPG